MAKKTDPLPPPAPEAEAADIAAPKAGLVTRVKTQTADLKERAEVYREDLEGRRSSNRIIDAVFGSYEHETAVGGAILAGAMAFRFFVFVVPYVFVLIFGFGAGSQAAGEDPADLARRTGIVGLAAHAIDASSDASTWTKIVTMTVATYALVSASRTMVKALVIVHALMWRVPVAKVRGLMKKAFVAIGVLTAIMLMEVLINKFHYESVLAWLVATTLFVLVPAGLWLYLTLNVFPSAPGVTWRDLWIGAALLGIGIEGLHVLTVVWISRSFSSKSETYGALGAALTILFWAYILGRLVTASASVSAVMWYKAHPPEEALDTPMELFAASSLEADLAIVTPDTGSPSTDPPLPPADVPVAPNP
ncbi:MAG TPA: YhjD/YihY/BrkB family envelope integrity protein [Ilumatobacteraceae bacterium]|jgi:uncharacterized BrkB/YihY/UPF0761 family membrane protein|nr:YhjD/YihY/BrkB family envelope integrity protein [Ilumatobacteraceae bacterium]